MCQRHLQRLLLTSCLLLAGLAWTAAGSAQETPQRGVFLVAAPTLDGSPFARSVILLKRHAYGSTIGVVVNRPTGTSLAEQFPDSYNLEGHAAVLYDGGPVTPEALVFLVRTRSLSPRNALQVFEQVFMSYDEQLLSDILRHPMPLRGLRVFRGHARWAAGQLEQEIARGDWLMVEADADELFDSDPQSLWELLRDRVGERRVLRPPATPRAPA